MFIFGKTCVAVLVFHASQRMKKFPVDSLVDCRTFPLRVPINWKYIYMIEI